MVGRRHEDGVDVVAIEHAAEVAVRRGRSADQFAGLFGVRLVNVANGDDFAIRRLAECFGDKCPARSATDPADADSLVRTDDAVLSPRGTCPLSRGNYETGVQAVDDELSSFHGITPAGRRRRHTNGLLSAEDGQAAVVDTAAA